VECTGRWRAAFEELRAAGGAACRRCARAAGHGWLPAQPGRHAAEACALAAVQRSCHREGCPPIEPSLPFTYDPPPSTPTPTPTHPAGVSERELLHHLFFCMEYAFRVLDRRPLPQGKTGAPGEIKARGGGGARWQAGLHRWLGSLLCRFCLFSLASRHVAVAAT
jgi:hypothetical protein